MLLKQTLLFSMLLFLVACHQVDGPYEGPVANNLCALEVFPVQKIQSPDTLKVSLDSIRKKDPFVRQEGLMVCRSY